MRLLVTSTIIGLTFTLFSGCGKSKMTADECNQWKSNIDNQEQILQDQMNSECGFSSNLPFTEKTACDGLKKQMEDLDSEKSKYYNQCSQY